MPFLICPESVASEAGVRIKPGVERSGTQGIEANSGWSPRRG
jgi:hypothetical protein